MAPRGSPGEGSRPRELSREDRERIDRKVDELFELDLEDTLPFIDETIERASATGGPGSESMVVVMQHLGHFFRGVQYAVTQSDLAQAETLLRSAAEGFGELNRLELQNLSIGMEAYATALTESQRLDISATLDMLNKSKDYVGRGGRYASNFESLVEDMGPASMFNAGLLAYMKMDYAGAKEVITRASQMQEQLARRRFQEGDPEQAPLLGLARLYSAIYTLLDASVEFSEFALAQIATRKDLTEEALSAIQLLEQGTKQDPGWGQAYKLSIVIGNLLEVTQQVANILGVALLSPHPLEAKEVELVNAKLRKAADAASETGPSGVVWLRVCQQLMNRTRNIELLLHRARPNKKGDGIELF